MAGPYVHCLVSRESLKRLYNDIQLNRFRIITNPSENAPYFPYVCLGSVSPDYPYPAIRIEGGAYKEEDENHWTWGDKFHKQNTGSFIDIGVQDLRGISDKTSDSFLKKAAWLMGYYTHIITDLVIHAVVYKLVGGCYENHSEEHLYCEVIEDAMLFNAIYSNPAKELVDVKFLRILQRCQEPPDPTWIPTQPLPCILDKDVEVFWDFILSQNYPDFYKNATPPIDEWNRVYCSLINDATSVFARKATKIAYRKTTELDDIDKNQFYRDITLPDDKKSNYMEAFNKAVDAVTERLKDFLNALDNTGMYLSFKKELGDWNMDKGIFSDTNPKFALWDGTIKDLLDCKGDPPSGN